MTLVKVPLPTRCQTSTTPVFGLAAHRTCMTMSFHWPRLRVGAMTKYLEYSHWKLDPPEMGDRPVLMCRPSRPPPASMEIGGGP